MSGRSSRTRRLIAGATAASFIGTTVSIVAPGPADVVQAATTVVVHSAGINLEDEGAAACAPGGEVDFCTLIGALEYAEQLMAVGVDVDITFDPSLFGQLFSGVGTFDPAYFHATVPAERVLTISGPDDAEPPVIDGLSENRLFSFDGAGTVELRHLQLQDGFASGDGGSIRMGDTAGTLSLDNVTISGGQSDVDGGAVWALGQVTITDSRIINTFALEDGGAIALPADSSALTMVSSEITAVAQGFGGAIHCEGCSVSLTDGSVISGSASQDGGSAIHVVGGQVTVHDSTIEDNTAFTGDGGGILARDLSTVEIVNSTLFDNTASTHGGAIACSSCAGVQVTNSLLLQNGVSGNGGAIYTTLGSGPLRIIDSQLVQNNSGFMGGAIMQGRSTLEIRRSRLVSNTSGIFGGGLAAQGAVVIESSLFEGNQGGTGGGGVHCTDCTNVTVAGSAFVGNTANDPGGVGGGADFGVNSSVQIVDTTFSANAADTAGQAINLRNEPGFESTASLSHVTITGSVNDAAALAVDADNPPAVTMMNSILAGNIANCDLLPQTIGSGGTPNIVVGDEAGTDCRLDAGEVGLDPNLLPLASLDGPNLAGGEPIPVHPFDGTSIANNLTACEPGDTDARGVERSAVACDVGAFELDLEVVTESEGLREADTPAALVPLNLVPASALTPPSGNGSDNSQALTTAQVRGIDLESSPLRNIPLRNIGLTASDVDPSVLGSISLAQVPLDYPGGWTGYLTAAGLTELAAQPLNTVNLLQVLTATAGLPDDKQLDLGQLDLSKTVLGSLSVGAIALAGAPLDDLSGSVAVDWCALIAQYTDRPCDPVGTPPPGSDPIYTSSATLVSLSLEGIPLRNIPLRNIPLRNIDLDSAPLRNIPLRNIPLRNIDLSVSPLRNIPLRNIPLRNITLEDDEGVTYDLGALVAAPLRNIPLREIELAASPLRNIPLRNIELAASPLRNIPLRNIPLRNIDVAASPLRNIPLRNIDLTVSPLRNIPLRNIPLRNIDVAASPLRNIPLRNINLDVSPLRNIPLRNITTVAQLVDCTLVDCLPTGTATIATAVAAEALLAGATLGRLADGVDIATDLGVLGNIVFADGDPYILGDIADAFELDASLTLAALADVLLGDLAGTYTLADLVNLDPDDPAWGLDLEQLLFAALTIHDLLDILLANPTAYGISPSAAEGIREGIENLLVDDLIELLAELEPLVTLADLFLGVIEPDDVPWDELDLDLAADGLRTTANPNGVPIVVNVSATVPVDTLDLSVDLPAGFAYVPGSILLPAGATIVGEPTLTPGVNGSTLLQTRVSMTASAEPGTSSRLGINVLPPLEVGSTDQVTATVSVPQWLMGATSKEGYILNDVLESNDDPLGTAPAGPTFLDDPADTLVVSYIRHSGDVDWFRLAVPQGQELSFNLSNLPADYDMLLFGPAQSTTLRGQPTREVVPAADNGLSLLGENVPVAQIGPDVDTTPPAGYRFVAGSARRGTDVERIDTGPLAAGQYLLKVSGYNGANAKRPYVLRTRVEGETSAQQCAAADYTGSPLSLGSAVTSIGPDTDTLVLVDTSRLAHAFPAPGTSGSASDVVAALGAFTTTLAGAPASRFGGTRAAVVDLAQVPGVQAAYSEWDDQPCDPELANGVVAAIGAHLDSILTPSIENLVIIGADDQIPMARLVDGTPAHNESEYAGTWNEANPVSASLALGYMLSDDPYSTASPIAIGTRQLFVPELAVGRLVESPQDIVTALTNFVGSNGLLDPQTAISTGYDFLEDGARAVADELEDGLVDDVDETLISTGVNAWTKADIVERLAVDGPDVASVNAHFDHYRALPADQDAQGRLTNPLTPNDLRNAPDDGGDRPLAGSVIFSMGCHGGLSVSDIAVGTLDADWAQTIAGEGAAAFAGNTGYGYGDTAVVAFSEELMRLFAERLSQAPTIGSAMAAAKQRYISDLAVISSFEEKVSSQVVFYGLPMYRIGGATPPPVEPFETVVPDVSGLPSSVVSVTTAPQVASSEFGTYYTVNGEVQATPYQPVQPRTSTDVTAEGRDARGALITGLVSDDIDNAVDPVIVTPADDSVGLNAEAASRGAVFPSVLQSIARVADIGGERDRLVLIPGQFRGDPDAAQGRGVQRLFPQIDARVFYAPAGNEDTTPPRIGSTRALVVNDQVTINVEVPDDDVVRVLAMYVESDAPDPKTWKPLELGSTDGRSWVGTAPAVAGSTEIDYFIQVLDSGGNVSVSSDKGANFTATTAPVTDPEPGDPRITLDPPAPPNGTAYTSSVTVTAVPAEAGGAVTLVVNGVPSPSNPVVLTESGVYTIEAITPGGKPVTQVIVIDATGTPPQASASVSPAPNPSTGWHTTKPVTVTMTGQAGSRPVSSIVYSLDSGPEQTVPGATATVSLDSDGDHTVSFRSVDSAGISSPVGSVNVKIDTVPPVVVCPSAPTYVLNQPAATFQATVSGAIVSTVTLNAPTNVVGARTATAPAVVDQAGNATPVSCPYKVTYQIGGFFEPITMSTVNKANAGRNIPVKWRLTDSNGQAVSNVASFVSITLSPGSCTSSSSDAIETYATASSSVPQYEGDGNWHLNWKTEKSLAGSCKVMTVLFDDGSKISAKFSFK